MPAKTPWTRLALVAPLLPFCLPAAFATEGVTPREEALYTVGEVQDGAWLLPNGRLITPVGDLVAVDELPLTTVISPDGRYAIASCSGGQRSGNQHLNVIDLESRTVVQKMGAPNLFLGLRFDEAGERVYASTGGFGEIRVYDFADGRLSLAETWATYGHVNGLDLGPKEKILYAVTQAPAALLSKDVSTGKLLDRVVAAGDPYTVVTNPQFKQVYVSSERGNHIDFYNVEQARLIRWTGRVPVGKNPQEMIVSDDGLWLYVANAGDDSFSIVDLLHKRLWATIDLRPFGRLDQPSSTPNGLAISAAGDRLYITQADENAVAVVSLPEGELIGRIPTAWYPTGIALTPDQRTLVISCGKGIGTVPNGPRTNRAMVQITPVPRARALERMSTQVRRNLLLPSRLFKVNRERFNGPVPVERGGRSEIEHVFFLIKENKTYDAVLGDWEGGRGDPANCTYCGEATINLHALVDEFGAGINYYSNAESSLQGHELATASMTPVYVEKQRHLQGRLKPIEADVFFNPATYPKNEYIFQNCLNNGVTFRDHGEAVGMGPGLLIFDPRYVHWGRYDPPVYWTFSRDVDKMEERFREWERRGVPQLTLMLAPNDHTEGCQFPYPSPESMVADNDEAMGRLVDWVSHSPYWAKSLIIVIQDDPQASTDHIDPHRSPLLLASPWVKRGYTSPVIYSEANIHSTIQHILNLPPMTQYDELAQPMWDFFTPDPDFTPWDYLPRVVPEGPCNLGSSIARRTDEMDWSLVDQDDRLDQLERDYAKLRAERRRMGGDEIDQAVAKVWRSVKTVLPEVDPLEAAEIEAEKQAERQAER